jgi:hypothetical protein
VDHDIFEFRSLPHGRTGNPRLTYYYKRETVAELAQQILIAAMQAVDTSGLKVYVRGDMPTAEELALKVIGESIGASVRLLPVESVLSCGGQ